MNVDGEIGVDRRYARFADGVVNDDALAARHEHAEVGVRLEARAGRADLDAIVLTTPMRSRARSSPHVPSSRTLIVV